MYIGGTNKNALHHLIHKILDNAIDEALAGHGDQIWITLKPNKQLAIRHNGRGIPVKPTKHDGNTLETLMTTIGTCGKGISESYNVTGGLHGVGISAVNALSAECTAEVARDGYLWRQTYQKGVPQTEVIQVRSLADGEPTGTQITIRPDFTILEPNNFDYEILADRAREVAYLLPTLTITLRDERENVGGKIRITLQADYRTISRISVSHIPAYILHSAPRECKIQSNDRDTQVIRVDVAFQYNATMKSNIVGYVNTVKTTGGYHTDIIPATLINIINRRAGYSNFEPFSIAEITPGLSTIVSVWHPHPSFESMTNITFIRPEIRAMVTVATEAAIPTYTDDNIKQLIQKLFANREALKP